MGGGCYGRWAQYSHRGGRNGIFTPRSQDIIRSTRLDTIYPRLPKYLNDMLLHFSVGTSVMYDTVTEFYDDPAACLRKL